MFVQYLKEVATKSSKILQNFSKFFLFFCVWWLTVGKTCVKINIPTVEEQKYGTAHG